ncbi:T9SS type A sorting domain-containing protein [Proteiniphilum sp.]|uniref:T9SS type A sorting domain-containing protein n=1 Tax=Proteiniphilum sp. TaxID=1926877 RepID=UPI002B209119|nr:T9SS type A sorting domain-containing protein [Proteiniphilum sp.]MEA4919013.1 T9SS type A sorting domain-containing protein [Proteiniphilum sp.]
MKNRILIISLLFVVYLQTIQGQTSPSIQLNLQPGQTFSGAIAGSMQLLNTDRIPYGVLYERVVGWALLQQWNSGDTTNLVHIKQAWWDLENSRETPGNRFDPLKNAVALSLTENKIPLIAINFGFGYVDSLALEDGRIIIENNQLIDAGGESPYITKEVHLAALSTEKVIVNTPYQLVCNSSFLLDNLTNETVTGYSVQNLANGQTVNLPASGTAGVTFTGLGISLLKITMHTGNGSYISYQEIEVVPSGFRLRSGEATSIEPEDRLLTSTIPFKGYGETTATISHADYHIYYHFKNGNKTQSERILKKPIVIVDGFDPMDDRKYNEIYDKLLRYYNGTDSVKLGDELRLKGYDVVILNFPITGTNSKANKTNVNIPEIPGFINRDGGADYIERNAFLLVKLIQELNAELQGNGSNEKLVVVGPSMGGQISRYALAYMEKKEAEGIPDMNHNTRLWLSFDSPHLGANIPLAIQKDLYFFGYSGGEQTAKDAYNKQLHSVAAQQMLIEQLDSRWGSAIATDGQNGTAVYHQTYYTALKNNGLAGSEGWPTKLRKVALVNGNGGGISTHQPSDQFLSLDAYKTIFNTKVVEIKNRFMPPTGSQNTYFKGMVASTGFLSLDFFSVDQNVTNVNQRGSMDIVQGGTINVQSDIKDQFSAGLRKKGVTRQTWSMMENHSFIPTVSALGFKNSSFNWNATINNRDLVQTGEIPFDNYYIPSYNQGHVSLTTESVEWLNHQLDGNYYNQIKKMTIVGPTTLCGQSTYIIDNLIPGATVQWSAGNNNITLISGQGTNRAVFRHSGFEDSEVRATITLGGMPVEQLVFPVNVCQPYISGASTICNPTTYTIEKLPMGATIEWRNNTEIERTSPQGGVSATFKKIKNGKSTVKANITVGSKNVSLYMNVDVGPPSRPWVHKGSTVYKESSVGFNMCLGQGTTSLYLMMMNPDNSSGYSSWEVTKTVNPENFQIVQSENYLYVNPLKIGGGAFKIRSRNDCGLSEEMFINLTITTCGGGGGPIELPGFPIFDLIINPNPTTDVVNVELKVKQPEDSTSVPQNMTTAQISGMHEIQLWSSASLLRTYKTDQQKYQVPVSGLPAGIYFIRVIKDGKTYTRKLIKR